MATNEVKLLEKNANANRGALLKMLAAERAKVAALALGLKDARDYLKSAGHKNAVAEANAALKTAGF